MLAHKYIIHLGLLALIAGTQAYGAVTAGNLTRQTFILNANSIQDDYVISVSLPEEYQTSSETYPLLLVLDGEYAFNSVAAISAYMQRDGAVRPFIVVGVSYGVAFGAPLAAKRSRDFTPPTDQDGVMAKVPSAYYTFLKEELIPAIIQKYRVQPDDSTLWSYSLSGAFASWLNYYDRRLFANYIIASPNVDYGILGKFTSGEIFNSDEIVPRKVFLSIDPNEVDHPENYFEPGVPVINKAVRELIATFRGYDLRFHVTQGESHATSWLVALPAGLRFTYGQRSTIDENRLSQADKPPPGNAAPAARATDGALPEAGKL